MNNESFNNRVSNDRIASRQMDEMIGLARGLCADGVLNNVEVEFLQRWLAANLAVNEQPILQTLWTKVGLALADGFVDEDEQADLFELLNRVGGEEIELGEVLKPSSLPLCAVKAIRSRLFARRIGANFCDGVRAITSVGLFYSPSAQASAWASLQIRA